MRNLWRVSDIAEYLGLGVSTVYRNIICKVGFPTAVRLGGRTPRWFPHEVERWVRQQRPAKK